MTSKQKEIAKLIFSIVLNGTIIGLIVFLLIQFTWWLWLSCALGIGEARSVPKEWSE